MLIGRQFPPIREGGILYQHGTVSQKDRYRGAVEQEVRLVGERSPRGSWSGRGGNTRLRPNLRLSLGSLLRLAHRMRDRLETRRLLRAGKLGQREQTKKRKTKREQKSCPQCLHVI